MISPMIIRLRLGEGLFLSLICCISFVVYPIECVAVNTYSIVYGSIGIQQVVAKVHHPLAL